MTVVLICLITAVLPSIKMSDPHLTKHALPSKPAVRTILRWDKANDAQYYHSTQSNLSNLDMSMFASCTVDCKCGNVQMIEYFTR